MRHEAFHRFGVERTKKGELLERRNFNTIKEAIEWARDIGSAGYGYNFITVDKYGNKIEEI